MHRRRGSAPAVILQQHFSKLNSWDKNGLHSDDGKKDKDKPKAKKATKGELLRSSSPAFQQMGKLPEDGKDGKERTSSEPSINKLSCSNGNNNHSMAKRPSSPTLVTSDKKHERSSGKRLTIRGQDSCSTEITNNTRNNLKKAGSIKDYHIVLLGQGGVGKSALLVRFSTGRFIYEYDPTLGKANVVSLSIGSKLHRALIAAKLRGNDAIISTISASLSRIRVVRTSEFDVHFLYKLQWESNLNLEIRRNGVIFSRTEMTYEMLAEIDEEIGDLHILDTANTTEPVYLNEGQGFIVIYSINDRLSFETAKQLVKLIREVKKAKGSSIVLVGNKVDLKYERVVPRKEGRDFAVEYECTFYETSAMNNINVAIIFHDLVKQMRTILKKNGRMNSLKNFFAR